MDRSAVAALRLQRFLETEPVIWLSTTSADGAPYLVPTWFAWDGAAILIRSKPNARKVRNLSHDPRTMLALGDAQDDFDVGLLQAMAQVETPAQADPLPAAFVAKYRDRIAGLGMTTNEFARTYSAAIRITPARALGWHGRSTPQTVIAAARRILDGRPTLGLGPSTLSLGGI
jgi:PPOX class probable F420-dependent enzyme